MKTGKARRIVAMLLAVLLLASLLTTVASAASSVQTSGTCTVVTAKRAWWDPFGWSKPKIRITNRSGNTVLIYVETSNGRYEVNGVSLKNGKSTDIKLKNFQSTYTVYASGGIYRPFTQSIQVTAKNNISQLW